MAHGGSDSRNGLVRRLELAVQVRDDGLMRHSEYGPEFRSCGVPERLDTLDDGLSGAFNAFVHMGRDLVSRLGEGQLDVGRDKARSIISTHMNTTGPHDEMNGLHVLRQEQPADMQRDGL